MTSAELLRRRAERLATPALLATVSSLELMVFAVGAARYAVPLGIVRSVLTEAVTPIPGAQAWVAGFINVRGEIKSVIDMAVALDQRAPRTAAGCVLLLETRHGVVGWSLESLPELQRAPSTELRAPLSVQTGVTGVLMGTIAVLGIDELLESLG